LHFPITKTHKEANLNQRQTTTPTTSPLSIALTSIAAALNAVFLQNLYCTLQIFFSDEYMVGGIRRNGENGYVLPRQIQALRRALTQQPNLGVTAVLNLHINYLIARCLLN
jgi:hypothetical protein